MKDVLFRCSSIGKLMTEPKTKAEGPLSVGAKTYIRSLVSQEIFGVDFEIYSKEMEKGIMVEHDGIALLNRVRGLNLVKNSERRSNEWITGECDLFDSARRRGHDIKCPWSIATFPLLPADCENKDYEYQMRGYMMLWDADEWEVNFTLVSTPEELVRYEPQTMHFVDHIPEHLRLTTWCIKRDFDKEKAIIEKIEAAKQYYSYVVEQFAISHNEKIL